jgi:3-oxoacyl-[acyl-carrier protein] reductase
MTNKTVLITGAGIGIGEATALRFARDDYHVVVTDVLEEEGEGTVKAIQQAGGRAEFFYLDVRDTDNVNTVCSKIAEQNGSLTTLVNNAGIAHCQPLQSLSDEQWDLTMDIDLKGMMRLVRASIEMLDKSNDGSIICLSSIAGANVGWTDHVPYTAAKGGISGLVKGLAIDLAAKGIRANAVAPGLIRTAQTMNEEHSVGAEGLAAMTSSVPLGRIGAPADIANVIAFLASDDAAYITGQTISVDGGLTTAL